VSLGSVIAQVGEVLGRAHALFGDPPASGAAPAGGAGARLAAAGDLIRTGQQKMSALTGAAPASYTTLAGGTAIKLDALAAADDRLAGALEGAAGADRAGRSASGAVVNNAAATTAGMAPLTATPAGQQALLKALRDRVAQQQQIMAAYKARDARMAAILRSLSYTGRTGIPGGGRTPMGGGGAIPFGGGAGPSFGGAGTHCQRCPHYRARPTTAAAPAHISRWRTTAWPISLRARRGSRCRLP
jgi:peptidoglycan DL-endopeptidase CwlO